MASKSKTSRLLKELTVLVEQAGHLALAEQERLDYSDRAYKADESVVTEADRRVEALLVERLSRLDPMANIVTEEAEHPFDERQASTFAIDPIDGTDVFSQGMPGWCVSVGLLNRALRPVAGVIYAPRLGLLLVAEVQGGATLNGRALTRPEPAERISIRSNLMVTSRIHQTLNLSGYVGKIRGIGSAALHLCYPLIYPAVIGALEGPGIHIWDMVAAHAINRALDQDLHYLGGDPIDYGAMVRGGVGTDVVMAGQRETVDQLRESLRRLPRDTNAWR